MHTPRRMSPPPRRMNAPQRGGMFPHTVTVYNQEVISGDKLNEITVNHITVLEGVLLISSKASNIRATGLEGADAVNLHIPFGVKAVDHLHWHCLCQRACGGGGCQPYRAGAGTR